jgi:hypothetical protein
MNSNPIVGAVPPPPGIVPNFTNPESAAYRLIVGTIVCPAITLVFLLLRLYTKRYILKKLLLDDCEYVCIERLNELKLIDNIDLIIISFVCNPSPIYNWRLFKVIWGYKFNYLHVP